MSLTIDLTPSEEARLSDAAKQSGLAPAEWVKQSVEAHLPAVPTTDEDALDAKLRQWQEQEGMVLLPDAPTQSLFARWAEEDTHMTDEEREAEDRLWEDLEKGLAENGGVLWLGRLRGW